MSKTKLFNGIERIHTRQMLVYKIVILLMKSETVVRLATNMDLIDYLGGIHAIKDMTR